MMLAYGVSIKDDWIFIDYEEFVTGMKTKSLNENDCNFNCKMYLYGLALEYQDKFIQINTIQEELKVPNFAYRAHKIIGANGKILKDRFNGC